MCSSIQLHAADNSSSSAKNFNFKLGKGSTAWAGVGTGTLSPSSPTNADLAYDSGYKFGTGGDLSIIGPFLISLSIYSGSIKGTLNYKYTDANNNTYSAQNVAVSQQISSGDLGVQVRFVNSDFMHIYGEGGAFLESWSITYDFAHSTGGAGSAAQKSSDTIITSGTYAKAGVDFLMSNGFGVRIFGRATKGQTATMSTVSNGTKVNYVTGEGFLAMVKQF